MLYPLSYEGKWPSETRPDTLERHWGFYKFTLRAQANEAARPDAPWGGFALQVRS